MQKLFLPVRKIFSFLCGNAIFAFKASLVYFTFSRIFKVHKNFRCWIYFSSNGFAWGFCWGTIRHNLVQNWKCPWRKNVGVRKQFSKASWKTDDNIFRGIIFRKEFSLFSKMVQATHSLFSVSPSSLRRKMVPRNPAFNCWSSVSLHIKIKIETVQWIKSRIWEKKEVNIQLLSPRFRSQQFFLSEISG